MTRVARADAQLTTTTDREAFRGRHRDHAGIESHAFDGSERELEPTGLDTGLVVARVRRRAHVLGRSKRLAEHVRATDANLLERIHEQAVREITFESEVVVLDGRIAVLLAAVLDPLTLCSDLRAPAVRAHQIAAATLVFWRGTDRHRMRPVWRREHGLIAGDQVVVDAWRCDGLGRHDRDP